MMSSLTDMRMLVRKYEESFDERKNQRIGSISYDDPADSV